VRAVGRAPPVRLVWVPQGQELELEPEPEQKPVPPRACRSFPIPELSSAFDSPG